MLAGSVGTRSCIYGAPARRTVEVFSGLQRLSALFSPKSAKKPCKKRRDRDGLTPITIMFAFFAETLSFLAFHKNHTKLLVGKSFSSSDAVRFGPRSDRSFPAKHRFRAARAFVHKLLRALRANAQARSSSCSVEKDGGFGSLLRSDYPVVDRETG